MTMTQPLVVAFSALVVINWTVAATLLRLAYRAPRIHALTERAWLALLIAIVTTLTMVSELLPEAVAVVPSRVLMVAISLYPLWWLWSYWTGRF